MNPILNLARGSLRSHDPVVLVVDDEPAVLQSIRRNLRNEPFEVITAGSGDEALGWLEELKIDVIITDQKMPKMKGTELIRKIQELFSDVPCALLTVDRSTSVLQQGLEAGASVVLYKGGDDQVLRECIRRLLRSRSGGRPGTPGEEAMNG